MKNIYNIKYCFLSILFLLVAVTSVNASSHREAPLISADPLADNVDLYAFRSPDNQDMVTIIATYVPLQLPHGGPNYYSFGNNIRYEIHVDNNAGIPGDEITYRFTFTQVNEDPTTFFNIRLGAQNLKTTYTLERSLDGGATFQTIITDGIVPPNNIGARSIESAVGLNTTYDALFNNAITTSSTGEVVFAGPTDDPFFVDLGGIFDLGNAPRQAGDPVDGLACMNVSAIAIQIPISTLRNANAAPQPVTILDSDYVIGVWASASRPAITTLSATEDPTYSGDWVQVSRLGMPLTNEAVIPVGRKDFWNSITPYDEIAETTLDQYFYNPELALYMDDDQFGGAVPAFAPLRIQTSALGAFDFTNGADGLFGLKGNPALDGTALDDAVFGNLLLPGAGQPRSVDLWPAFHTGVPNVRPYHLATGKGGDPLATGKPFVNNFLPNGGDMLRLNMAVPATPRDDANFSSLGLIQAAAIGLTVAPFNQTADLEFIPNMDGFPNGRRLEDDVTRIELQAVGGVVLAAIGLWYDDYDPMTSPSPVTQDLLNVLTYTTGVESNDKSFSTSFPYLAMPHSGTGDCGGAIYNDGPDAEETGRVFVSSNNQGRVGVIESLDDNSFVSTTFVNKGADADGIYYDESTDVLYQLNRSNNTVDLYGDVLANLDGGTPPSFITSSTTDFINGREIAVSGNKLVVAQDANDANGQTNKFIVYNITNSSITFDRTFDADINLWGIHLDGSTMYAIQDNSGNLVRYDNFFSNPAGSISPSAIIAIEGMVRTHGLTYDQGSDIMILTDVGEASSPTDGAFTVVTGFTAAADDATISLTEQARIEGPMSSLGNPVDVAFDVTTNLVYIAERASDGGKVLVFDMPSASGDANALYTKSFAGASAIYLQGSTSAYELAQVGDMFISSNNAGMIGLASISEDRSIDISSFASMAADADGIYYDDDNDVLYQLNRTDNVINAYSDVKASLAMGSMPTLTATSTSDFINGRELAVAGDRMVVAQDANDANGQQNRLLVYQFTPTEIKLKKSYDVAINLWGIHADVNTLYAIEDNSDRIVRFDNFFENTDAAITADMSITIEDMVRTHGLTYDAASDLMIMTDVGDAASADDGALIMIPGFTTVSADGTVSAAEQTRIAGASTFLGNPVDVAYNPNLNSIYVVERANGGGRVLTFDNGSTGGDVAPTDNDEFAGASAIYLTGALVEGNPTTEVVEVNDEEITINVLPNPTADFVKINIAGNDALYQNSKVDVFSLDGRKMTETTLYQKNKQINVSNFAPGIYVIMIEGKAFTYQKKFTKI